LALYRDPRLEPQAVRARYNDPVAYAEVDQWHKFTEQQLRLEVARSWSSLRIRDGQSILNAGAGGNDLGLHPPPTISLDISEIRIAHSPNPVVASIEAMPLANQTVDTILCVGSVINYCDAAGAISEFSRVLRLKGYLVLEFESSRSAELLTQDAYGRPVAVAETFFAGQQEAVWVYSPEYIKNLLSAAGFATIRAVPIQILSPWVLLITHSVRTASVVARLDRLTKRFPVLSRWASNHLLICQKHRNLVDGNTY